MTAAFHPLGIKSIAFGPFRILPQSRVLLRNGKPIDIGGRALDILILLSLRSDSVVSKEEINAAVWPGISIEDVTIRSHINAMRTAIEDGRGRARYILTVPKRGYTLAHRAVVSTNEEEAQQDTRQLGSRLHSSPKPIFGRATDIEVIASAIARHRVVSIVGPGGIGKTAVVSEIGQILEQTTSRSLCFVDLSTVDSPENLVGAVAIATGGTTIDGDVSTLTNYLAQRSVDLILDGCEHLIADVASLAEKLLVDAPDIRILVTSREALRIDGEFVYLLDSLNLPKESFPSADEILASPAVQMFIDRSQASGFVSPLNRGELGIIANLCRQLDGNPLAIQLVASRVPAYGLTRTYQLLVEGAVFSFRGTRSSAPRHQTLRGTIDWSYQLLSQDEKETFRRLSVFVGRFDLKAAVAVIGGGRSTDQVHAVILSLVDKSLLAIDPNAASAYFRLLNTTHGFAAELLGIGDDEAALARQHARHFFDHVRRQMASSDYSRPERDEARADLGNIRKALSWALSHQDKIANGAQLAAYASPIFLDLCLYDECSAWCQTAIKSLHENDLGGKVELLLQESLSLSLISSRGITDDLHRAIERGLELASQLDDLAKLTKFLTGMQAYRLCRFDSIGASVAARNLVAIPELKSDPTLLAICEWSLGNAQHLTGNQTEALKHFQRGMNFETAAARRTTDLFGVEHRASAISGFARCLWVSGFPDQALKAARQHISELSQESAVTYCHSLLHLTQVAIWCGELQEFEPYIHLVQSRPEVQALPFYEALALAVYGELLVAKGDATGALANLKKAYDLIEQGRYLMLEPQTVAALATALTSLGRNEEGLRYLDRAFARIGSDSSNFWLPELLRVRFETLKGADNPTLDAIDLLQKSVEVARRQGARGWELKSTVSLAKVWVKTERLNEAYDLLDRIIRRFEKSAWSPDLANARDLQTKVKSSISERRQRSVLNIISQGSRPSINGLIKN
ncbi:ATP-binding protein [Rhizobium leguminosarum]|uniref:ATP-binding protein n=1 Tax=Rhizobium leguminosarum TaxID=384 RepID=UPI003F9D14A9